MLRISSLLIGIFLLLALASGFSFAKEAPFRLAITPQEIRTPQTNWYGVYLQGKKVGYAKFALTRSDNSKDPHYVLEQKMNMKIISMGEKREIVSTDFFRFDNKPPYALHYARHLDVDGFHKRTVEITRTKMGFDVIFEAGGESQKKQIPSVNYALADALTPDRWFRENPSIGESITVRGFDISEAEGYTQTFKVLSAKNAVVDGVSITYYEASVTTPEGDVVDVYRVDNQGNMLSFTIGGQLELRLEAEELAKKIEYSADLFVNGMAFIDRPLGDPLTVKTLVVEVMGEGASNITDGPRQFVTFNEKNNSYILKVGPKHGKASRATPEEILENLQETIGYPVTHHKINEIAKKAIGDAKTPMEKVRRLLSFVNEYIKDEYSVEHLSVFDIISEQRGDCSEHALLFTTLARAIGIPAREVYGLSYMGDDILAFCGHAWNEIVVGGQWLPVDSTLGQTEMDAAHIRLAKNYQGKVSFRLLEVNHLELPREELQTEVMKLLKKGNISLRRNINKVYTLGNIYEEEGNVKDAIRLYSSALKSNPWNLKYQLRMAKLLAKNNKKDEAIDKARLVYDFAEDKKLIKSAEEFLTTCDVESTPEKTPVKVDERIEIVLVPLGDVDRRIILETKELLKKRMGIKFSIHEGRKEIGNFDRTLGCRYVSQVFESIKKDLKEDQINSLMKDIYLTTDDLQLQENKIKFIYAFLERMGDGAKRTRFQFDVTLARLKKKVQYNYSRLLKELQEEFPLKNNDVIKGYLAITGEDLYDKDYNYVFGLALVGKGYGVMSYHRFTARFNGTDQNRPRLIKRTLKQALSSANFLLGIPRCSNPNCARAYPHSLQEHDQKSDELCSVCKSNLDKYIKSLDLSGYIERGNEYYKKAQYDQSVKEYKKAAELEPHSFQLRHRLGYIYGKMGLIDESTSEFKEALIIKPDDALTHNNLGYNYYLKKMFDEAIAEYKKALAIDTGSALTHYNLSLAYYSKKQFDLAIKHCDTSKQLGYHVSPKFLKLLRPYR